MEQGGNAIDAAVATALCQGIYNPMASGIGGGTFMLIRLANGTAAVIDAREVAPAAANETMFSGNSFYLTRVLTDQLRAARWHHELTRCVLLQTDNNPCTLVQVMQHSL